MAKKVDHRQRAGQLWPYLIEAASRREELTYRMAAEKIGIHWRPIRFVLGPIQQYCLEEGLPRLTAIVYSQGTGIPGAGYAGMPGNGADLEEVFDFDWKIVPNPFSQKAVAVLDQISDELCAAPDDADKYVNVLSRGDQQRVFRNAVLKAYDYECAICGNSFSELLEAAHIIPWSSGRRHLRIDPRNGICLCANHHKLFDSGWISLDEQYRVILSDPEDEWENYGPADRQCSVDFHGKQIRLPANKSLRPSIALLTERAE